MALASPGIDPILNGLGYGNQGWSPNVFYGLDSEIIRNNPMIGTTGMATITFPQAQQSFLPHSGCITVRNELTVEERIVVGENLLRMVRENASKIHFQDGNASWSVGKTAFNLFLNAPTRTIEEGTEEVHCIRMMQPVDLPQTFQSKNDDARIAELTEAIWETLHRARHRYGNHTLVKQLASHGFDFSALHGADQQTVKDLGAQADAAAESGKVEATADEPALSEEAKAYAERGSRRPGVVEMIGNVADSLFR